ARHLRVGEDAQEFGEPAPVAQPQPAPAVADPAAAPAFLILVGAWIALSGTGFDVVEPDVLGPRPVGPRLFAGDRAGMAADALVEVHHHRQLRHDSHVDLTSRAPCGGIQNTTLWLRRRTTVTSSR